MNAPVPPHDSGAFDPRADASPLAAIWRTLYWTYDRATWQYDLMVIAILAFVWLTPPDWLADPTAHGLGPIGWIGRLLGP